MTEALYMVRRGSSLIPLDDMAAQEIEALPGKKVIRVRVTAARSVPQHRLYWSMLKLVVQNLDQPTTEKTLHKWIKLRLGVVEPIRLKSGKIIELPGSIAFEKMTQAEFDQFFRQAADLIVEHIIPGLGREDLIREARAMIAPKAAA